jgi:hypothetical protein
MKFKEYIILYMYQNRFWKNRSGLHSGIHSGIHSGLHSGLHSLLHSGIHSGIHSGLHSLLHSLLHSGIHSGLHSLLHSGLHSLLHSGIFFKRALYFSHLGWIFDHFWPLFWRLWADYLSLVFEVNFGPFFCQFSIADFLVLRDFLDFACRWGPLFRPLFDRAFAPTFQDFWNPVSSPCRFRTSVDTLPIRTLICVPPSI